MRSETWQGFFKIYTYELAPVLRKAKLKPAYPERPFSTEASMHLGSFCKNPPPSPRLTLSLADDIIDRKL